MENNYGGVYSNQQELSGWLDEQIIMAQTLSNELDTEIQKYNNWVLSQEHIQTLKQMEKEVLVDVLRILALAI